MTDTTVIFNQSLEVSVPTEIDSPYSSEPVLDFDTPVWKQVPFLVSVQPAGSSEGDVSRPVTVSRFVMITPPGTDIPELAAESKLRVGGVLTCDVVGEPARWPDPFRPGVVHHLEAELEVTRG